MPAKPSYAETLQYLKNLEKYGMSLGFKRIKALLKFIGNPQDKLQVIHVGGTNGKGSTSAMIASILMNAGYKVGLYTSPHLIRFNERIRINVKEISNRKIAELVERIRDGGHGSWVMGRKKPAPYPLPLAPTFFEFTTAMAFLYFADEKVDIAVMEVGLGGRLDATNVGKPLVSVITNIAKDHETILGSRIRDIAFEKAGIIKKRGILISGETKPAALRILMAECKRKGAVFYRFNKDFFIDNEDEEVRSQKSVIETHSGVFLQSQVAEARSFIFKGRRWVLKGLKTNLLGRHQHQNAACALAALEVLEERGYSLPESAARKGLWNVLWPGRFEILSKKPLVILDCAHNPAGADVLKDALCELRITNLECGGLPPLYESEGKPSHSKASKIVNPHTKIFGVGVNRKLILVLGIMADKDIKGILSRLAPLAYTIILTRPKTERAAPLDMLYKLISDFGFRISDLKPQIPNPKSQTFKMAVLIDDVKDACRAAISMANSNDVVCITGSVFTVGEAREALRQLKIGNCKLQGAKL